MFDGAATIEVVKCTARTADTLTVTRAQEGTAASAFAAGVVVELRATKGTFEGLVQRNATETLTNKNLTSGTNTFPTLNQNTTGTAANVTGTVAVANGGTGVTSSTGTGSVVLSNSPTLVTPTLGTPASGTLTNCTGLPAATGVTGTLPIANGGTGATDAATARTNLGSQATLVSGTNIKTVNGNALLGSGDLAIAVTPVAVSDQSNTSTGYFDIPAGTTAQRPATPNSGMTRMNTTTGAFETYTGSAWVSLGVDAYLGGGSVSTNTAVGNGALTSNTTGSGNTALGYNTGLGITTGSNNTILGANVTGLAASLSNNIIIADGAGNRRINVDASGNVGIGTTSPNSGLHVYGSSDSSQRIRIDGTGNYSSFKLAYNGADVGFLQTYSNTEINFGSALNIPILIYTNNTERMRIRNDGNVGIGAGSPGYQLTLSLDSAAKPTTSTWTVSSDARLKTDIVDATLSRCYEVVKSLPLKHYRWKDGLYADNVTKDKSQLGWIAQDVEAVFPKAVHQNKMEFDRKIEDGVEEYEEQEFTVEMVDVEKTEIKIIDGKPVQVLSTAQEEKKTLLFDEVEVKDEAGNVVMVDDKPLTHQMPRMVTKTRPKMKPMETIEDCRAIDSDQIIKVMYGTIQLLMQKVEMLEAKLGD